MLFVVPPLLILAGWAKGTRPDERRMVAVAAALLTIGAVPAVIVTERGGGRIAQGCVYALALMAMTCLAMLLRTKPGPDDGGGEEPAPTLPDGPELVPFDWNDFERGFWADVERRRRRPRVPVA
jgi:hypothetical protein